MLIIVDREESTKGEDYALSTEYEEENGDDWEGEPDWNDDEDEGETVKDENTALLDYWGEEVNGLEALLYVYNNEYQAKRMPEEVDDELEEEGVLDSPLDKLEPYGMFKNALMRMSCIIFSAISS